MDLRAEDGARIRKTNGRWEMGHGRWEKRRPETCSKSTFPRATASFPNGPKSAAPKLHCCTAALYWGRNGRRNSRGIPVLPQFPRAGTVGTVGPRGKGAKEASHGSRLRPVPERLLSTLTPAAASLSPAKHLLFCCTSPAPSVWAKKPSLSACGCDETSPVGRRHAHVPKYTCLALSHPNLAWGPPAAYHPSHRSGHRHCSAGSGNQHGGVEEVDGIGGVYGESSRWQSYTYNRTQPPRLPPSPTDAIPNQTAAVPNSNTQSTPNGQFAVLLVSRDYPAAAGSTC
jgi:hypothetical protein